MGDPYASDLKRLSTGLLIEIHLHCFTRDHLKNACFSYYVPKNESESQSASESDSKVGPRTGRVNP